MTIDLTSRPCVTHHYACDCRERQFDTIIAGLRNTIKIVRTNLGLPEESPDGGQDLLDRTLSDRRKPVINGCEQEWGRPPEDRDLLNIVADKLAFRLGDTFIDFNTMVPNEQWRRIMHLLEDNGYHIHKY